MKKPRSSIFACATNGEAATTSLLVEQFKKYQFSHIGVDSMIGRVPTMYSAGSMRVSDILVLGADACDTAAEGHGTGIQLGGHAATGDSAGHERPRRFQGEAR